jgi:hypothetical protein
MESSADTSNPAKVDLPPSLGTSDKPWPPGALLRAVTQRCAGQTIALIALGGGYLPDAIDKYFSDKGVRRTGRLEDISVLGATNALDGQPLGGDGEVQMSIETP